MTQALLLVAWPYEDQVLTSFRYADGYSMPAEYTGNATLTQIRSKVDDGGYEVLYRCEGCFSWEQGGAASSVSTSQGYIVAGYAQGKVVPGNPGCPSDITFDFHDDGFGQSGLPLDDAPSESYEEWAALASNTVTGSCGGDSEEPPAEEEPESPDETSGEGESESPQSPSRPSTPPSRDSGNPTTADRQSWQDRPDLGPSRPSWPGDDDDDDAPWWEDYVSGEDEDDTPRRQEDDEEEDDTPWWEEYVSEEDEEEDDTAWWEDYVSEEDEDDTPWWEEYVSEEDEEEDDTPWWEDYVSEEDEDDNPWWEDYVLEEDEDEAPWWWGDSPWGGDEGGDQEDEVWPRPEESTENENTRPPRLTSETGLPTGGENTRPTRSPRPTPTFGPGPDEPDEETNQPSETGSPTGGEDTRPTRPPRPTPTFWPDPWAPDEPSVTSEIEEPTEEPSDQPSKTSEVEEPTEEPSDQPSDDPSSEEPSDQPSETESPSEAPGVSFEMPPTETPQTSDSENPVETELPEESVTETPEESSAEGSEPVETETEAPEESEELEPVETETDTPEEPNETETPEPPEDVTCTVVDEDETFDYIVVGAGAGGIPVAERLTSAGHKVLLIEKGPPSTDRWGGDMKPEWLEGEPLTRFDVPGLCNQIWHDSTGIVCTDMDQIAGCVLGGGTAVNAGLWWKVSPLRT